MNIHEYQAKELLLHYGVKSPYYFLITSYEQLLEVIEGQDLDEAVLKVQIHAGGRGKAGGVKIAHSREEIKAFAREMLNKTIVNNQTGPRGVMVNSLILTPLVDIKRELYMSILIDRARARIVLIASPEGGIDIEEVALKHPEKLLSIPVTDEGDIRGYNLIKLNKIMGWSGEMAELGGRLARGLAKAYVENDASLIEINPLVETADGELLALDAKMSIDDNALYRQKQIAKLYDPTQLTVEEAQSKKHELSYVGLDGNIGCMVNGAGLAMATMDTIKLYGGDPANFLDVTGGASENKVAEGFGIILSDPKVKAILVNIFGGITDCEVLARGIISATKKLDLKVPLVVVMEGTNVEKGRKCLSESGLKIVVAHTLDEGAKKIVELASGKGGG